MMMRMSDKSVLSGAKLQEALDHVADELLRSAEAIRVEDAYGSHVTAEQKARWHQNRLDWAAEVRQGLHCGNMGVWQRVNMFVTGECAALLP